MTSAEGPDSAGVPPEILNMHAAADYLGVSTKTFQKVLREGDIPGRKVGREWKFSRQALADWVGRGRSRDFLDATDRDGEESQSAMAPGASARPQQPLVKRAATNGRRSVRGERALEAEED